MFFIDKYNSEGFLSVSDSSTVIYVGRIYILMLTLLRMAMFVALERPLLLLLGWNRLFIEFHEYIKDQVSFHLILSLLVQKMMAIYNYLKT